MKGVFLMRIINIDLSQDSRCPQKVFGGNAREHNESKLIVKLPDRMIQNDISYYFFEFQTVLGEYIVSPNIYKASLIDKNKISVTLWEQLIPAAGDLLFCVDAVNLGKDNSITIKGKTSFCALQILKSPTGDSRLIDISSTKEELQEVIDKALQDAKDSGDFKGDPGDVNTLQMNTACANALKGNATGQVVSLTDISPNEHTLGVKVRGKNLIPYPYYDTTKTQNGITFTVNADGSISFSGTSTAQATFYFVYKAMNLKQGVTYTLSASGNYSFGGSATIFIYDSTQGQSAYISLLTDVSATFTPIKNINNTNCYLVIPANRTVSGTLKPQLELGSTATAYTPYISDLSTVTPTRCRKNLIPYPYTDTTKTLNGITFTVNSDGSVTVSGTATAQAYFKLQQSFSLKKGQYFFSGCPTGGAGGTYSLYLGTADYTFYKADVGNGIYINAESDKTVSIVINIAKDTTVENLVFKPQLELGSTATTYEPYQGQTYTPAADGTVSGVKSLYPTTTLMTDTEGAIIEAEYNRDINKAFAELQQAILSMGGNT